MNLVHDQDTPAWRKSRYSRPDKDNCVEVGPMPGAVGIRDTKNPDAGAHFVRPSTFRALINAVKSDGLQRPL